MKVYRCYQTIQTTYLAKSRAGTDGHREYLCNSNQTTLLAVDKEVIGYATICYTKVLPTFDHPSGKLI